MWEFMAALSDLVTSGFSMGESGFSWLEAAISWLEAVLSHGITSHLPG
jgi:hypothetical protein